jgi:hypothetical protein
MRLVWMVPGSAPNWTAVNAVNNPASTTNMTTLHLTKSSGRSPSRRGILLLALALAWFALLPAAPAVTPAPDGGYPRANTAVGENALLNLTSGRDNTAIGFDALINNTTGSSNIALGPSAGVSVTTGNDNIYIGNKGTAAKSNTIHIGTNGTQKFTFIAGISGATVASGVGVIVDTNGHLGTIESSTRFKEAIKPMDKASEAILALQPVTFRYKHELDPDSIPQFGLVAEQVEKVNPDLVARDAEGKPYTVRYEAVNAMLLNEFLKQHCKVEEQQKHIQNLTARLKEQAAQIQKVTARIEVTKPAPPVGDNNQ